MRIAVASQNFRTVTPHAGKTRRWLVYEAGPGVEPVEVERLDLSKEMALHDWQEGGAPHPLFAMDAMLVGTCGGGFIRRMARNGVRAAVATDEDPVAAVRAFLASGAATAPLALDAADDHHHGHDHGHGHGHGGCTCGGHDDAAAGPDAPPVLTR